jgi:hypothetical protein
MDSLLLGGHRWNSYWLSHPLVDGQPWSGEVGGNFYASGSSGASKPRDQKTRLVGDRGDGFGQFRDLVRSQYAFDDPLGKMVTSQLRFLQGNR